MQFQDSKGQARLAAPKAVGHDQVAAAQHRRAFAPAGGHIDHLQRMHILPIGTRTRVVDQVNFEMSWLALVPGNRPGGDVARQARELARRAWAPARLILAQARQAPVDGGLAHAGQLLAQAVRQVQFAMARQLFGHRQQIGR
jgi:hypothetical protein